MDKIKITGGQPLHGIIYISGAKNSALKIMAATILADENVTIHNIPHLVDIKSMINLLAELGMNIIVDQLNERDPQYKGQTITFNAANLRSTTAPYELVKKMRASILVLGPLLAKYGKAKVSLPGGCAIGARPVDMHIKALKAMGAKIDITDGYIVAEIDGKLKGCNITFDKISVGATENSLMAATLAEGETIINNAAREPEIIDLANLLNKMGAKITGQGTSTIKIIGVDKLGGAEHSVIYDRIEAGTYAIAAIMTKGDLTLQNIDNHHYMQSTLDILAQAGANIDYGQDYIRVYIDENKNIKPLSITTAPYPGLATDMQAQFMALMLLADGESLITENIFENRFMHAAELMRMGAEIRIDGNHAIVTGSCKLKGAEVMATDLRASVSLVLSALVANGETTINRVYHLDRGYECLEDKLSHCGASIYRVKS